MTNHESNFALGQQVPSSQGQDYVTILLDGKVIRPKNFTYLPDSTPSTIKTGYVAADQL